MGICLYMVSIQKKIESLKYITNAENMATKGEITMPITVSSELMKNYKQTRPVMPVQHQFEALQTIEGRSLFFSIAPDSKNNKNNMVLYLIREVDGHETGWEKFNLSQFLSGFHKGKNIIPKKFSVSQRKDNKTVDIVMAITVDGQDYLYLAQNSSNTHESWTQFTKKMDWHYLKFDDSTFHPKPNIVNISTPRSHDGKHMVVDIVKNPSNPIKFLKRYYIDLEPSTGQQTWNSHDLPEDFEINKVTSRIGRKLHANFSQASIDGIYTLGHINNTQQLIYVPLDNKRSSTRLSLPSGVSAIATTASVRPGGEGYTDLFIAGADGLYYWAYDSQLDIKKPHHKDSPPKLVVPNSIFNQVKKLFAHTTKFKVVVWGLNSKQEVFYTSFDRTKSKDITDQSAWTHPVPLLTKVSQVVTYVNLVDDSNTFFAHYEDPEQTDNNRQKSKQPVLKKAIQSPETTLWKFRDISLKPPIDRPAQRFSSYTTRIQITEKNQQPKADKSVNISASTGVAVYINHKHYNLGPIPTKIKPDALGSITIVEPVTGLHGTRLTVAGDNDGPIHINPMDKPFKEKIAKLNTVESLNGAQIKSSNVKGTTTSPLIASKPSTAKLKAVAAANHNLSTVYSKYNEPQPAASVISSQLSSEDGIFDVLAGDLYQFVKQMVHTVEVSIASIEKVAGDVWHFIVHIAGDVYRCVLNSVEAVVGAVEHIFKAIKTEIEDVIKYAEFLFEWHDIVNTKEVMKNLFVCYLRHQFSQVKTAKQTFDSEIGELKKKIDSFANFDGHGLGSSASKPINHKSTPAKHQSTSTTHLSHHVQHNVHNIQVIQHSRFSTTKIGSSTSLKLAIKNENQGVKDSLNNLDLHKSLEKSFSHLLKEVIAKILDGLLDGAQKIIDALLSIIIKLGDDIVDILDAPIYIPVISDILEDIGVPKFSVLDLFCWIGAVPTTIIYKIMKEAAPFPDGQTTTFLKTVSDWNKLAQAFSMEPSPPMVINSNPMLITDTTAPIVPKVDISQETCKVLFISGHIFAGVLDAVSAVLVDVESLTPEPPILLKIGAAVPGILSSGIVATVDYLDPKDPLKDFWATFREIVGAISIGTQAYLIAYGLAKGEPLLDRKENAVLSSGFSVIFLGVTIDHLVKIAEQIEEGKPNEAEVQAILGELRNISSYTATWSYTLVVNDINPYEISSAALLFSYVCHAGLNEAQGFLELASE